MVQGNPTHTMEPRSAVAVLDAAKGTRIGHVLKASWAGLLIVAARPFGDAEHVRLRLENGNEAETVEVTVEAVYCESSRFSTQYGVGFAILEIHQGELADLFPHIGRARFGLSA